MMGAGRRAEEKEEECKKMEVKLISQEKEKTNLLIKGASTALVNAFRRIIMEEVPAMAIEDIEIRQNNSALYDEMIGLRLGLLPLTTELKDYNLPSECKCKGEGCAQCQAKLTLKAKGPGMVYASQIKSDDPKVKPVYPKMPIVSLLEGQEVELEARAVLGRGKEHTKWSPGIAYYQQVPEIEIVKADEAAKIIASLPKNKVFEEKGSKIAVNEDELLQDPKVAEILDGVSEAIAVKYREEEFIFTIESWGQLEPKEMVSEAMKILLRKADEIAKQIKA